MPTKPTAKKPAKEKDPVISAMEALNESLSAKLEVIEEKLDQVLDLLAPDDDADDAEDSDDADETDDSDMDDGDDEDEGR